MAAVTILGAGSWGTALGAHLARLGHEVALWARNPEFAAQLETAGENTVYLPGVRFPPSLKPVASLAEACAGAEMVVFVCPSSAVRGMAEATRPHLRGNPLVVSAVKGVEQETHVTMSAILEQVLGDRHQARVAVLSGPSFAREVGQSVPTAVTAAARDLAVAEAVQRLFTGQTFRVYTSTDMAGVEIGGAVKNVIAVAAGVSDGLGFGYNSRAALITRGLAEITRLDGGPSARARRAARGRYGQHEGSRGGHAEHALRAGSGAQRGGRDADHGADVAAPLRGQAAAQVVVDLMTRGLKRETD